MAVFKGVAWGGQVPFIIADEGQQQDGTDGNWVRAGVDLFNDKVKRRIWVPAPPGGGGGPCVRFVWKAKNHNSPIGQQAAQPQEVHYYKSPTSANPYQTLHHEMGHALGMGHENFNTGWPHWPVLDAAVNQGLQPAKSLGFAYAQQRLQDRANYRDHGAFDPLSIMLYSNESFLTGLDDNVLQQFGITRPLPAFQQNAELSVQDIAAIRTALNPQAPIIP
jgi:hypothetical protein